MNLKGLLPQDKHALERWLIDVAVENLLDVRYDLLLRCGIGRIAANNVRLEYPKTLDDGWGDPFPRRDHLRHILDWIVASVQENARWLSNVDASGRPRKLLKCSTYDDLMREADKAMAKKHGQHSMRLGPDDEQPVAELNGGYRLVRLLTPEALDLESFRMHHCVGDGAYDGGLAEGGIRIFSLRDPRGRPVVTIEIDGRHGERWEIDQIRGKQNGPPDPRHMAILKPYATAAKWHGRQTYWPTVADVDGIEHDIDKVPVGTTFNRLGGARYWGAAVSFPTDLTVLHDAVFGHGVPTIPERLTVYGNLYLATSREKPIALPESLQVGGWVIVWAIDEIAGPIPVHLAGRIKTSAEVQKMSGLATFYGAEGLDSIVFLHGYDEDEEPRLPQLR
ncbi:hypothetical protein EN850_03045 [Mesorhizobium sp. M8A.F.Ca.ET.207.01.1.1]|uniref:PcfJ domain-containing protein n=1 Tax=Mesorhizobium sp. M8A.F.Ca.ET.207.01.1.1 TaxID=2563968 RepID=UPI00109C51F8|nr:PcfJ domain-containing protein [Mesorhizobium sp. M8A.F.Ca.ET.207.01.1.1]TGQ83735.1 hypothetical protein EN850_03045 [Mesorhizobium sp. M8A.F.Ca.ET.207.01.1.1]